MMAELPEGLKHFIARDLIYFVGGGSVLTSFLYHFDRVPAENLPIAFYLLGAGIAYVVGYTLQDTASIVHLVTTHRVPGPNWLLQWIYRHFTGEPWKNLAEVRWDNVGQAITWMCQNKAERAEYQRLITLMMVATTMAPCGLISGLLVLGKWYESRSSFDLTLGIIVVGLAVLLLPLAWLKAAQVTQYQARAIRRFSHSTKDKKTDLGQ